MVVGERADEAKGMDQGTRSEVRQSGRIPEEKIVLRYTSAIRDKYVKYLHYRRKGIVRTGDAYVIAVNRSGLAYRWASAAIDLPRFFFKAVYPIGELAVVMDVDTRKLVGAQNRPRFFVHKENKSAVSVQTFILGRRPGLSAVICSDADVGWSVSALGSDFELAHNLLRRRPIARGTVPTAREWWAELSGTQGENSAF